MPLLRRISRTARSDSRARLGPPGRRRRRERDVLRQDTACRSSCSISWHTDTWGRRGARWSLPATSLPPPLAAPFPSGPLGNLHTLLLSPPHLCVHLSFSFLQALSPPLFHPFLISHSLPSQFPYFPVLFLSRLSTSQLLSLLHFSLPSPFFFGFVLKSALHLQSTLLSSYSFLLPFHSKVYNCF